MAVDLSNFYSWMDKMLGMSKEAGITQRKERNEQALKITELQNAPQLAQIAENERQFNIANPPGFAAALGKTQENKLLGQLADEALGRTEEKRLAKTQVDPLLSSLRKSSVAQQASASIRSTTPFGLLHDIVSGFKPQNIFGFSTPSGIARENAAFKKAGVQRSDILTEEQEAPMRTNLSGILNAMRLRKKKEELIANPSSLLGGN
jgi:hypothetical protein